MVGYHQIDQQIHLLAQIIAKVNRTFVPRAEDDSHTNLSFDAVKGRLFGRWIDTDRKKTIFCLNLTNGQYEWLSFKQEILQSFPFENRTIAEIEQSVSAGLPMLGLNPEGFKQPLHFEIPGYDFAGSPVDKLSKNALCEWMNVRQLANVACSDVLRFLQINSEIRIWPHHFDTGIYVVPNSNIGLGFGLAMKDSMVGAPYFFMAGYSQNNKEVDYQSTSHLSFGHWIISGNWKGAVLSLEEMNPSDHWDTSDRIQRFIEETLSWYLTHS